MSFIDKALEKAKDRQRQESPETGTNQAQPQRLEKELRPPRAPLGHTIPVIPEDDYSYTITRTVPVNSETLRRQRIITGLESDFVKEEYKLLRTQILQRTKPEQRNTLMVTGPMPGEGKTLTAINLAISISHEVDTSVLLVDADLRQPVIHQYFGLPPGPGLGDYLAGDKVDLRELLVHPEGFPKFVILPGGKPRAGAAELVGSPMMAAVVQDLKEKYANRYVIFDLPPLLAFADSMALAPSMDGIILVVEMGRTPREQVRQCLTMLKDTRLLGCVLNKIAPESQSQSYYSYK